MQKSETIKELAAALCKFQAEVSNPKNTATNPKFNSKYAPLEVVISAIKPILAKYKLSFMQSTSTNGENIIIKTIVLHESGEWIESDPLSLPAHQIRKGGGKDFTAQGVGSAITYGRRYSLSAMFGISSEDDDDANHASHQDQNNQQQRNQRNQQQHGNAQQGNQGNQGNWQHQDQYNNWQPGSQNQDQQHGNPQPGPQNQGQNPPLNLYGVNITDQEIENVRARYIQGKGDDEGFVGWVEGLLQQGQGFQSIMNYLNQVINLRNQRQHANQTQGA